MKFKGIVIGLLAAILVVNTVMAGLLVTEAKKQSEYERITAEATITNAHSNLVPEGQEDTFLNILRILNNQLLEVQSGIKAN